MLPRTHSNNYEISGFSVLRNSFLQGPAIVFVWAKKDHWRVRELICCVITTPFPSPHPRLKELPWHSDALEPSSRLPNHLSRLSGQQAVVELECGLLLASASPV